MFKNSDEKIKKLVSEFAKNHDFDSHELMDGISVLERYNWNVLDAVVVVKLNLDPGELLNTNEWQYLERLVEEKNNQISKVHLSSDEKISRIRKFFKEGYCSFEFKNLEKVIDQLDY